MEALKVAIPTKDELLAKYDVKGSYPAFGLPETVHVDNAKHYNAMALKTALARIGVSHRTMPVLKAWYKGTVERLIGTLTRQVFHTVPGTTHSSIFERDRELVPEQVAEASIDELRRKLTAWMVGDYQHRHHKGIDDTPFRIWKRSVAVTEMRLPPSREDLESALSLTVVRIGRKDGIQFKNLVYRSEHLTEVLMRSKNDRVRELVVRVDRENLEAVEFYDQRDGKWLPAFLREDLLLRVMGRTLEEYELVSALRKTRGDEFSEADPDFKESYAVLEGERERQASDPKLSERVKAAGARERLLKSANNLTNPEAAMPPPPGQDLGSLVQQEADRLHKTGTGNGQLETPAPEPPQTPAEWAAKQNLGARVRKPKGKE